MKNHPLGHCEKPKATKQSQNSLTLLVQRLLPARYLSIDRTGGRCARHDKQETFSRAIQSYHFTDVTDLGVRTQKTNDPGRENPNCPDPMGLALGTIRLAEMLGCKISKVSTLPLLPYSTGEDHLVFDAPLVGFLTGLRSRFLRGWKQYDSCIKGFNALGLLSEHIHLEEQTLLSLPTEALREEAFQFLKSRTFDHEGNKEPGPDYWDQESNRLTQIELSGDLLFYLAIWRAFSRRPIICSTSSNMGISLHQALRALQSTVITFHEKQFFLLNKDEGRLVIWCPDEGADFMNDEKTSTLRSLERESPPLTRLRTYINRKERDPGALKQALENGGYFFPTNPQSREEMQNLLSIALHRISRERKISIWATYSDPLISKALRSLGVEVRGGAIIARSGVEGGLYGLMVPYLILLEETLQRGDTQAISTWNQASIGAALAAAVLTDCCLQKPELLSIETRREIKKWFPNISGEIVRGGLQKKLLTRIHGVFDLANLQSLSQLYGVIIKNHLSGRGTAYVGLGSSSYANGNRCFDILRASSENEGPFRGKGALHPATHTINPVAQALIYGEDLHRVISTLEKERMEGNDPELKIHRHVKKPEPAGAAALAGYLLSRLDDGTLSYVEIAFVLKLLGFRRKTFLEFSGFEEETADRSAYIDEGFDEGECMGLFATNLLAALDCPIEVIEDKVHAERVHSQLNYFWNTLDDRALEDKDPIINFYLTGDNCRQPNRALIQELYYYCSMNQDRIKKAVSDGERVKIRRSVPRGLSAIQGLFTMLSQANQILGRWTSVLEKRMLRPWIKGVLSKRLESKIVQNNEGHSTLSFREEILGVFTRFGQKTFLIEPSTGHRLTYQEFYELSLKAAVWLQSQGVRRKDRVCFILFNSIEFAALYFGSLFIGAVAVPINPEHHLKEIEFILLNSDARHLIYSPLTEGVLEKLGKTDGLRRHCVLPAGERSAFVGQRKKDAVDLDKISSLKDWSPMNEMQNEDLFCILFSSGTTGSPKGISHRIDRLFRNASVFNQELSFGPDQTFMNLWPMSYSTGFLNTLLCPFMAGAKLVLLPAFEARSVVSFWTHIVKEEVDVIWASPTMLNALLLLDRDPAGIKYCHNVHPVFCIGTAPLSQMTKTDFEKKYQVELFQSYGLSELLIVSTNSGKTRAQDRSVGTCLPGVLLKIQDPGGQTVGSGIEGEIWIRTPYMMTGYLNVQSKQVESTSIDDWFKTGDIGYLDAENNLYITDRKKDLIIRGGLNISPRRIEEVLYRHPAVKEAAVLGLPNDFYGEEVVGAIVCKEGSSGEEFRESVLRMCKDELDRSSVPSRIVIIDKMPMGPTGKILKNSVRDLLLQLDRGKEDVYSATR